MNHTVTINLTDFAKTKDKLTATAYSHIVNAAPKKTRITISDADTGEIIDEVQNKVVITGAQFTACKLWNIQAEVPIPNYNDDMHLDRTRDYETFQPIHDPVICLFGIGNDGCGPSAMDVKKIRYTERIEPEHLIPFRYQDMDGDLNDDLRKYYYGRKELTEEQKIAYYFKLFDTQPQLHLRYLDGTQLTPDVYNIDSSQAAECYVEVRCRVTRNDFRDYFEQVVGWENAVINSFSLLYAWYDDTIDDYLWFQQITPYSKLAFSNIWLVDLTKAIDFNYQVYY